MKGNVVIIMSNRGQIGDILRIYRIFFFKEDVLKKFYVILAVFMLETLKLSKTLKSSRDDFNILDNFNVSNIKTDILRNCASYALLQECVLRFVGLRLRIIVKLRKCV